MNIVLTGSLGTIGKTLTLKLVKKGHSVTVISSKAERQAGQGTGTLYEDYCRHQPTLGKVKLTDFAQEFVRVYNQ